MTVKLTYFDFDASRGLECRLALTAAGVDFEDDRIERSTWPSLKATTPFGGLPTLTDGARVLGHSNAILEYIGRGHGLHPTDAWAAAEHLAIMESVEQLRFEVPRDKAMSDADMKAAREKFAEGWLSQWARTIDARIGGPFLEGAKLMIADIKVYTIARSFKSGGFDHIPSTFFDKFPKLAALIDAVDGHAAVKKYFASRS